MIQQTVTTVDEVTDLSKETAAAATEAATAIDQQRAIAEQTAASLEQFETTAVRDLRSQVDTFSVGVDTNPERKVTADGGERR